MIYKKLFFKFFVKPLIILISGINLKNSENLKKAEQFIIIANHNSHLDILAIMSVFKTEEIMNISPVAASDYFFKNKYIKWISTNLIDIIPINRRVSRSNGSHPLDNVFKSIESGKNLIIFPEGSRGEAEELQKFKNGIGHIAKKFPNVNIVPIVLENTGKCLPKNEALFVPFIINMEVKESITFEKCGLNTKDFVLELEKKFK